MFGLVVVSVSAVGQETSSCAGLPNHEMLTAGLKTSVTLSADKALPGIATNGGFETNMWATVVDRNGVICAIARSDDTYGNQWPGSRVVSAQKASAANAFSLPTLALSTSNLYAATQRNKWASGLQFSNPVSPNVAYAGDGEMYGTAQDPLVGKAVGGVNIFGGGLALYSKEGELLGAIGASGDTSCADHNVAWRTRDALQLDYVPAGIPEALGIELPVGTTGVGDNVLYDFTSDQAEFLNPSAQNFTKQQSTSGFGQQVCLGDSDRTVNAAVVSTHPLANNLEITVSTLELYAEAGSSIPLSVTAGAESEALEYRWSQLEGISASLVNGDTNRVTINVPEATENNQLLIEVLVSSTTQSVSKTIIVNVVPTPAEKSSGGGTHTYFIALLSLLALRKRIKMKV